MKKSYNTTTKKSKHTPLSHTLYDISIHLDFCYTSSARKTVTLHCHQAWCVNIRDWL